MKKPLVVLATLVIVAVSLTAAGIAQPAASGDAAAAFVANLHSDFAMFRRDLSQERGVNLIGASIVSDDYPGGRLGGRLTFWWFGWPPDSRHDVLSRALAQIDWVDAVAAKSGTTIIRSKDDLERVRAKQSIGFILWMEGGDPLADDPAERVQMFFDRGVRAMMLTHLYDNALGGSGSPSIPLTDFYLGSERGLTDGGRAVLNEMGKRGIVLDLAHASRKTFWQALDAWAGPVVVSHTAMDAIYHSPRLLTDDQVRAIARRGGLIGIMGQTQFLGGKQLANLADHVLHAVSVAGPEHVALGLDIEDAVNTMPADFRDTRDLGELALVLRQRGLTQEQVRGILGKNAFRFFDAALPPAADSESKSR